MKFVEWLRRNKLLAVLSVAVASLLIAVIALAHKNAQLNKVVKNDIMSSEFKTHLSPKSQAQMANYRLPKHIVPKNYKLTLRPDMNNKTFSGTVVINIDILQPTKQINLHSNKLNIGKISIANSKNQIFRLTHGISGDTREFLLVDSEQTMEKSNYYLNIEFSGRLDKRIIAIYASSLKNGGYGTESDGSRYLSHRLDDLIQSLYANCMAHKSP